MRFMNEYDVEEAQRFFDADETPNLALAASRLNDLVRWTNANSDGWAYWPRPARSAAKVMERLDEAKSAYYRGTSVTDLTDRELSLAFTPVKAFLTRQGVSAAEVFSR